MARHCAVGVFAALMLSSGLSACASLSGSAEPILDLQSQIALVRRDYPEHVIYRAFESDSSDCPADVQWPACRAGMSRAAYRNTVINLYVSSADAAYHQFRLSLSQELKGTAFGSNLAVLIINSVSIVSGDSARRALAAGSAFLTGAQASVSRDLFIDRTLPTVLTAMEAARTRVKTDLVRGMSVGADEYPLFMAMNDIRRLQDQARLETAMEQLSQITGARADLENRTLQAAYTPDLQGDLAVRKAELMDRIEAADEITLEQIAVALQVTSGPTRTARIAGLRVAVDRGVSTDADLTRVADLVRLATARGVMLIAVPQIPEDKLAGVITSLGATTAADATVGVRRTVISDWIKANVQTEAVRQSAEAILKTALGRDL
ncbi:hypothetical protein [Brevundimonas sp. TWP2-3-2]|uniref:hypothetical protein n=1 Tax=unclassified Brevundimonas TaxID=2622653 RepID=UPI003CEF53B5